MMCGAFLQSRGSVFTALASKGFAAAQVRRSWAGRRAARGWAGAAGAQHGDGGHSLQPRMSDPAGQEYISVKPGLLSYAVLVFGKQWRPDQDSDPHRNRHLELGYLVRRTPKSDALLFVRWIAAWIESRGNVKERKVPERHVS
jgi:hypothetical protein